MDEVTAYICSVCVENNADSDSSEYKDPGIDTDKFHVTCQCGEKYHRRCAGRLGVCVCGEHLPGGVVSASDAKKGLADTLARINGAKDSLGVLPSIPDGVEYKPLDCRVCGKDFNDGDVVFQLTTGKVVEGVLENHLVRDCFCDKCIPPDNAMHIFRRMREFVDNRLKVMKNVEVVGRVLKIIPIKVKLPYKVERVYDKLDNMLKDGGV